jgi:hypothetical protein
MEISGNKFCKQVRFSDLRCTAFIIDFQHDNTHGSNGGEKLAIKKRLESGAIFGSEKRTPVKCFQTQLGKPSKRLPKGLSKL